MAVSRPLPEFSSPPPLTDEEIRARLYNAVSNEVRELTSGRPITRYNRSLGRDVVQAVTEILFRTILEHGYFRFPNGYGSIKIVRRKPDPQLKRLPTGQMVQIPPNRVRMVYEEGAAVRETLGIPSKTNYTRRYRRQTKLSKKTLGLLDGTV